MSTFSKLRISMAYYFREMHIETNAVSRKSRPLCERRQHAPYVEEIGCIFRKILAGNKTMLIIPDFTLHMMH